MASLSFLTRSFAFSLLAASLFALLPRPALAAADDDKAEAKDEDEPKDEAKDENDDGKGGKDDEKSEAKGDGAKGDDDEAKDDDEAEDFGHMGQFGIRAGLVGGLRMVLRYDDSPYCAEPDPLKAANNQRKFCGHMAPFAVDLGLSFALLDFLEPFAWARLGLGAEEQTDTNPVRIFGAGLRLYMTSDAMFKIFIEPAVALEFEKGRGTQAWQANAPQYRRDFVFHLAAGPQVDFHKNFGAFFTGGVTVGIVRAIHSSLELALGVQGRFP